MRSYESKKFTFTTGDTTHTFANFCGVMNIWSPSEDFQIEFDTDIDADSFLVPKDTMFAPPIGVKELHIKGSSAGGTAYIIGVYQTSGIADREAYNRRGGIDL